MKVNRQFVVGRRRPSGRPLLTARFPHDEDVTEDILSESFDGEIIILLRLNQ